MTPDQALIFSDSVYHWNTPNVSGSPSGSLPGLASVSRNWNCLLDAYVFTYQNVYEYSEDYILGQTAHHIGEANTVDVYERWPTPDVCGRAESCGATEDFGENVVNKTQIASTELATLSAKYRYNGTEESPKVDFKPVRYDYVDEGYSLFHHPSFIESRDEAVSNHSYLALTDRISFEAMAKEVKTLDPAGEIVLYVTIKAPNGKYLKSGFWKAVCNHRG